MCVGWLAFGCARIAGLTDDYHLAPSAGGQGAASGASNAGSTGGDTTPGGGEAGANGGEAGVNGGEAGVNGGSTNGGSSVGGGAAAGGTSAAGSAGVAGAGTGPVHIGSSVFNDSAAGNDQASSHLANASFAKPAGTAAGDFMLVFFGSDHSLQHLTPNALSATGWTLIDQQADYGTDGQAMYLLYKFAAADEPNPIVFQDINSVPSGNGVQGLLSVYRGVNDKPIADQAALLFATGQTGDANVSTPTPAVATTVANCLLIAGLSPDSAVDAPVVTVWPDGFDENRVSVTNPQFPYPNGWANIYQAERHVVSAMAVPGSAFKWKTTAADQYYGARSFILALAPAP